MTTDAYQPCPCGIDKKIKFCCGSEVLTDLAKVEEALGGEQRLGALDLCNRLIAAGPNRACLHMYKAMVQLSLRETGPARETTDEILRLAPGNPAGLALSAMLDCHDDRVEDAIEKLQHALEAQEGKLVNAVYEAIGVVGRSLAAAGEPIAAQAHLLLQVGATRGQDQNAMMALLELEGSGEIPLAVAGATTLTAADANSPLAAADVADFNAALRLAEMGCWLAAAKKFESLAQKTPGEPALWKNIGVLRARLINNGLAASALKRYASFQSVPRDLAVEAMALALYLSEPTEIDFVNEVTAVYAVTDPAALKEHLLSNKRVQNIPIDPAMFQETNEPPPMAAFLVLDREIPATSAGLSRDNVPKVMGEALLFGKQTDRPARVEFSAIKTADYEARLKALQEAIGQFLGPKEAEDVSGKMSAGGAALAINWRFPDDAPVELRKKMVQEHRTQVLLSIWPNLPMGSLGGKTPRVAVADPAGQIALSATILMLDLNEPDENPDFNKLRRSLGLPTLEPIDPAGVRVQSLTPPQQTRLVVEKLSDDDLAAVYRRAVMLGAPRLVKKLAREVVARPSLDNRPDLSKAETYDVLSRLATEPQEALAMILKAVDQAKAQGQSPARYLLTEFTMRLRLGDEAEAKRVLNTIMSKHMREPGVAQAVYSLLAQLGLIEIDPATGRPVITGAGGMAGSVMPAPAAAAAPSGLWTPDQGAPTPAGGKSKLWMPGMD
jgi:tetratricopeptide (TPR) repeat protein